MANQQIYNKEIQKRIKDIEAIYQKSLIKLNELKKKQDKIINDFVNKLEQKKIEEIRKKLK